METQKLNSWRPVFVFKNVDYRGVKTMCMCCYSFAPYSGFWTKCRVSCTVVYTPFFLLAQQPPMGQGLLIHEASVSQTTTPLQSVGLLWTSDQLVAETSTWQHTTVTTDKHSLVGFEPTISAGERAQTYALDGAATGTGRIYMAMINSSLCLFRIINTTKVKVMRISVVVAIVVPLWTSYRLFRVVWLKS